MARLSTSTLGADDELRQLFPAVRQAATSLRSPTETSACKLFTLSRLCKFRDVKR